MNTARVIGLLVTTLLASAGSATPFLFYDLERVTIPSPAPDVCAAFFGSMGGGIPGLDPSIVPRPDNFVRLTRFPESVLSDGLELGARFEPWPGVTIAEVMTRILARKARTPAASINVIARRITTPAPGVKAVTTIAAPQPNPLPVIPRAAKHPAVVATRSSGQGSATTMTSSRPMLVRSPLGLALIAISLGLAILLRDIALKAHQQLPEGRPSP